MSSPSSGVPELRCRSPVKTFDISLDEAPVSRVTRLTDNIRSETNAEKQKSAGKPDGKDSLDEPNAIKKAISNAIKRDLSPCEGKERSLDCPSMKLTCQKSNARLKTVKDAISGKSLLKIHVENCWKEPPQPNSPPELPEESATKENSTRTDYNSIDSVPELESSKSTALKNKKCAEESNSSAKKPLSESKNKFTWCGSCKSSKSTVSLVGQGTKTQRLEAAAAAVATRGKRTSSTSPLKKLSRASLTTESIDNSRANLSKYSPCASRLAASSKILSSDSLGATSPESPLHVGRARSPVQASLSLNIQRPVSNSGSNSQPPQRSKSTSGADSCVTSPTSDAMSCSPPGTEILSLEDVSTGNSKQQKQQEPQQQQFLDEQAAPRAVAPASAIELSLDRGRWSSNQRSPR